MPFYLIFSRSWVAMHEGCINFWFLDIKSSLRSNSNWVTYICCFQVMPLKYTVPFYFIFDRSTVSWVAMKGCINFWFLDMKSSLTCTCRSDANWVTYCTFVISKLCPLIMCKRMSYYWFLSITRVNRKYIVYIIGWFEVLKLDLGWFWNVWYFIVCHFQVMLLEWL